MREKEYFIAKIVKEYCISKRTITPWTRQPVARMKKTAAPPG
jgi:hypothetical protein